ncbi:response regulator [Chloroflexota bacterium]
MVDEAKLPWMVELRITGAPSVAKLKITERTIVGRADKEKEVRPDLDLTPWGAMEMGVAPEHVAIFPVDEQLMILGLDADKPTLLNGERLGDTPRVLSHGDDLQLGVLHLQVNVVASPTTGSVVQRQPGSDFQLFDDKEPDPRPGKGQSILIVEDEPDTAEIFRLIIERAGFKVLVSREVVSAIRVLNTESPSAIILDLMLPDIHGLELCRYVRRDIEQRDTPIVIVSAAVTQATINQSLDVGADVFLGKPVSMKELVDVVASLVKWYEAKKPTAQTKRLAGTAKLKSMPAEVRQDALIFFISGYQEPVAVVVPNRITVGRRSGSSSRRPHVDLDRYGAFDSGVSRIHAAIHRDQEGFYLEDLGSSNGTFIANVQIEANKRYPLKNAAEVSFGDLHVRIYFFDKDENIPLDAGMF